MTGVTKVPAVLCLALITCTLAVEETSCDADMHGQCSDEFAALQSRARGRQGALVQVPTDIPACKELTAGDQCPSSVEGINTALTCQYNSACTRPGGPVGCWGATGCQYYDVAPCKALTQPGPCPAELLPGINTALDCVYNEKCMSPGGPVGCWGATGCQYYIPTPATALAQEPNLTESPCGAGGAVDVAGACALQYYRWHHCTASHGASYDSWTCSCSGGPPGSEIPQDFQGRGDVDLQGWASQNGGCCLGHGESYDSWYLTECSDAAATVLAQEPTDIPACKELTAGDQCPSSVEGINTALTCQYNSACTRPGGPVGCWGATGCQYYDVNICKALTQPGPCPAALPGINTALDCVYNEKCMSPGGPVGCWGATGCQYYTPTPATAPTAPAQEPTDIPACKELTAGDQCPSSVEGINTALTCQYNSACTKPGGPVGCWGATGCQYYDDTICKALTEPGPCPAALPGINTALDCVYNEKCMSPGGPVGCWGATGCQYYSP